MSRHFSFNGPFEDMIREVKDGIQEFVRAMSEEAQYSDFKFTGDFDTGKKEEHEGCCNTREFRFEHWANPRARSYKTEDGTLIFQFMLPGFEEKDIELFFKGDAMVLKASLSPTLKAELEKGPKGFLKDIDRREYRVPAQRYDQEAVKALLRNGILTVSIPAKPEDTSDAIKVEIIKEGQ